MQIDGDWQYDSRHSQLLWSIELIDGANRSGSAEFVVPSADPDSFFPVDVSFSAPKTLCDIQVRLHLYYCTSLEMSKSGSY